MAYDAVTPIDLSKSWDSESAVTPTAITHANTIKIGAVTKDNIIVYLNNTYAGEMTVTFTAGDFGARSELGDLEVTLAQDAKVVISLETSRFLNSDGYIYGEYSTNMTGYIWAVIASRN